MRQDEIRGVFSFELLEEILYFGPYIGEIAVSKFLDDDLLSSRVCQEQVALSTASVLLCPDAPNTTQTISVVGFSSSNLRIVPPQPISMSSLCAPRHKI